MPDSACRCFVVKKAKIFYVKHFKLIKLCYVKQF